MSQPTPAQQKGDEKEVIVTYKTDHPRATKEEIAARQSKEYLFCCCAKYVFCIYMYILYVFCIYMCIYSSGGRNNTSSV